MRKNKITCFLLAFFMCFAFWPVGTASAESIDDIVAQMQEIYGYMDDYDKGNVDAARAALQEFVARDDTNEWNAVLGDLLTPEVITRFGDEESARAAAKDIFAGLGEIYYSTNATELRTTLETYKADYIDEFQLLFGADITMDEFYQLFYDARTELPGVIDASEAASLANDPNESLIAAMPVYLNEAMDQALIANSTFSGRLSAIGWSTDKLIAQQEVLAGYIDQDGDARLSLAMTVIRSETELAAGPTSLQVGDSFKAKDTYSIKIMGRGGNDSGSPEPVAALVGWGSADSNFVQVTEETGTGNYIITAIEPGKAQLIVYREYGDPLNHTANDWLLKFDVTVEASDILYGDVNDDGIITSSDHQRLFEHLNGTNLLTGDALIASDVNKDGNTTSSDHQRLFEHLNGTNPLS